MFCLNERVYNTCSTQTSEGVGSLETTAVCAYESLVSHRVHPGNKIRSSARAEAE